METYGLMSANLLRGHAGEMLTVAGVKSVAAPWRGEQERIHTQNRKKYKVALETCRYVASPCTVVVFGRRSDN